MQILSNPARVPLNIREKGQNFDIKLLAMSIKLINEGIYLLLNGKNCNSFHMIMRRQFFLP